MKRILTVLCVLSLLVLLAGCFGLGGSGDWDYPLPNDYVISRMNAVDIQLVKMRTEYSGHSIIPRFITEFAYNDRYVGLERLPLDDGFRSVEELNRLLKTRTAEDCEYYLVDTETDTVLGPFDAAGFAAACEESGAGDLGEWIETSSLHWNSPGVNTYGGKK